MRIVHEEYKVYEFDELKDDIKKKVLEKEKEYMKESYIDCCLYDDMGCKASDLINDYFGITSDYLKTYYDLSYCQGSGAMVEFDINIVDLNNKYKVFSNEEISFMVDNNIIEYIDVRHDNSNYYHEYTFSVNHDYYNGYSYDDIKDKYGITEKDFETLDDRFYELVDDYNKHNTKSDFVKDIIKLNKELCNYGYDCIESDYPDEEIIENIKINGYEYLESGDIYGIK